MSEPIRYEDLSQEEAFAEGDRERRERLLRNRPQMARLRMVGGPHDGGLFPVPPALKDGAEIPVRLPAMSRTLIIPGERPRSAVYAYDRSMGVLRFTGRTIVLNGGA